MAEKTASSKNVESSRSSENVVILFSGDSGDGMQLTGDQFTNTSAIFGNDVSTFPDFPAEIRAPAGTLAGLSGFQVNFSSEELYTAGDAPQVLVAMNPAALKANLPIVETRGTIIVNVDAFTRNNLRKAGYEDNPLDSQDDFRDYDLHKVPLTSMTRVVLEEIDGLSNQARDKCKNALALGLVYWIFDRPLETTENFYKQKFAKIPDIAEANIRALRAGYNFGLTTEAFQNRTRVPSRKGVKKGKYRRITGNDATIFGLVTSAKKAGLPLFYGSYPITPASSILEGLAALKNFDVRTFQAEDEIAAIGSAIGASFGGCLAVTASSGPGISLKSEAINLAVVMELPLVVINVQRGGPSTGLPTKTEQSDLLQVLFGRNGQSPIPVVAPATPGECFKWTIEAARIAIRHMTPVFLLSDGYIANSSEPWLIPCSDEISEFKINRVRDPTEFQPYMRDLETLSRPWALPGTAGFEHRVGGLGKQDVTGNVSYDPDDHQEIINIRQKKIDKISGFMPHLEVDDPDNADLLVLGWGGTYGAIREAIRQCRESGYNVSQAHLRMIKPFPTNLGEILLQYKTVLVPELNMGQLRLLLQSEFNVSFEGLNKVEGRPFKITEISEKIVSILNK
ncbi:MAG: 2-oxoacid:acceptor oxidoreductase subunit alpha [Candidatus Latescibacterota bacterium]|nr:2-oxoacid:acceptor oxidoreductase subunit alpha [Candidatus Latescibacterota bacterium]